ncbi:MAG: hypothetical protein AW09_004216 [Candidatus Accumulibacter phosphatis]|uniref:Uncharacterized protein n=1 Tax=Candidatus Accumulibacter phosphatis TaxID=327160 RepID=A0A080M0B5_9PROT|nr:MAG: hypothetical protein AW09_004216 [Candidatus Accumulibacter phosphatis]
MRVDHQTLALPDRADDRVTGNRLATGRELNSHAFGAANHQRSGRPVNRLRRFLARQQAASDDTGEAKTQTDVGVHLLDQFVS